MTADEVNNALSDPELLGDICGEVGSGGTLTRLCVERGLNYKIINRWINDDPDRQKRYKTALDIREDHAKDLIIAELIAYLHAKPTDAFETITRDFGGEGNGTRTDQALKNISDMPPELQRLISGVEFEEVFEWQGQGRDRERVHVGRIHKIKFWDKPRSIETFMKHLAMLVDRKQVDVKHSLADLVNGETAK